MKNLLLILLFVTNLFWFNVLARVHEDNRYLQSSRDLILTVAKSLEAELERVRDKGPDRKKFQDLEKPYSTMNDLFHT